MRFPKKEVVDLSLIYGPPAYFLVSYDLVLHSTRQTAPNGAS